MFRQAQQDQGALMRPAHDIERGSAALSFREALVSPCASCQGTPCCQYLPLQTFALATITDVDYALYLLNFDNLELGVAPDGAWSAYYRQACRFLAPDTLACRLHGTPDKPHVCQQYNPYSCFYRGALSEDTSPTYLRIDRRRMRLFADTLAFDDDRRVVGAPTIEGLLELFGDEPVAGAVPDRSGPDVAAGTPDESGSVVDHPCEGCAAYCCTSLMFPMTPPVSLSSFDYIRFALGFPGTEVVVVEAEWHLSVRTRCQYLVGRRCGAFGSPERPLRCQYYDEWTCGYRPVFAGPGSPATVRLRLEDFPALADACLFNRDGTAAAVPTADQLRPMVEAGRLAYSMAVPTPTAAPAPSRRLIPLLVTHQPVSGRA